VQQFDVVILGGGLVGASLAAMLKGFNVAVVEAFSPPSSATHNSGAFDERTTVLSAKTQQILANYGLWDSIADHCGLIKQIEVSDRGHFASAELSADEVGAKALGWVATNALLGPALFSKLDHVSMFAPDKAVSVTPRAQGAEVMLESKEQLSAQLVVIADGAGSALARSLGIQYDFHEYQHTALLGTLAVECKDREHWAYERFTDEGAVALLPMQPHPDAENCARYSLVWAMPHEQASVRLKMSSDQQIDVLQQRFGDSLGKIQQLSELSSVKLTRVMANEQIRQGVLVMGNAAHALHPVAGQGFNLSARDVDGLARLLRRHKDQHLGDIRLLQQYLDLRQNDQWWVSEFSHHLSDLFSRNEISIAAARGVGVLATALSPTLRQGFTRKAMGF